MSTNKTAERRAARRIGVNEGANFEERRQIILREAARVFSEKGVHNTSLDDVATRLGVTKPALYHYVSSKNEIIRQCLGIAMENNQRLLREASEQEASGLIKLRYLFGQWSKSVVSDFGRAMATLDLRTLPEESRRQHLDVQRTVVHGIEDIIREGIDDGSIRNCNVATMTLSLIGLFNSPARWYREGGPLSIEEVTAEQLSLLENGVAQ